MSYTINKQWSNPNVPKADGLWTFQRVMRDAIGRPCEYCGAHTKYLHSMNTPSNYLGRIKICLVLTVSDFYTTPVEPAYEQYVIRASN